MSRTSVGDFRFPMCKRMIRKDNYTQALFVVPTLKPEQSHLLEEVLVKIKEVELKVQPKPYCRVQRINKT